jgi:hypothetical protein
MLDMTAGEIGEEPGRTAVALDNLISAILGPSAPRYDASLLISLKEGHRDLITQFVSIGHFAQRGPLGEMPATLASFKLALQKHLITINVGFYTYIEYNLAGDEENLRLIHSFRRELNTSARSLARFIEKYDRFDLKETQRQLLLKDYAKVGSLLAQRIQREEANIFPLYQRA